MHLITRYMLLPHCLSILAHSGLLTLDFLSKHYGYRGDKKVGLGLQKLCSKHFVTPSACTNLLTYFIVARVSMSSLVPRVSMCRFDTESLGTKLLHCMSV